MFAKPRANDKLGPAGCPERNVKVSLNASATRAGAMLDGAPRVTLRDMDTRYGRVTSLLATCMLAWACNGSTPAADAGPGPVAASGGGDAARAGRGGQIGGAGRAGAAGKPAGAGAGAHSAGADGDAGLDADSGAGEADLPTLESAMRDYRSWKQRSSEPQSISSEILALCRLPSSSEQKFTESEHGMGLYLMDWLNAGAQAGFAAQPFPRGAAIVKEKLRHDASGKLERIALGIMVKREAGFDPAHNDWSFGYWQAEDGLRSGAEATAHCGGCHAGSKTDYVFVDMQWRQGP
jgi:hypothetical protein